MKRTDSGPHKGFTVSPFPLNVLQLEFGIFLCIHSWVDWMQTNPWIWLLQILVVCVCVLPFNVDYP